MSELGDTFREYKEHMKPIIRAEKDQRLAEAGPALIAAGLTFKSKNEGEHLIVYTKKGIRIDFWPSTGRWAQQAVKGQGSRGRSIETLLDYLQGK